MFYPPNQSLRFWLLILLATIGLIGCGKKGNCEFKSRNLTQLNLRGTVQSIKVTTGFEERNARCKFCEVYNDQFDEDAFTEITFDQNGIIQDWKSNRLIKKYNKDGDLIGESFLNKKGVEYGYTTNKYFPASHHNWKWSWNDYWGLSFEIDSVRTWRDTIVLTETGTLDKFYTGPDPYQHSLYRLMMFDSVGNLIVILPRDIQSSLFKMSYDTSGNLLNKTEIYQGFLIDSTNYFYDINGELVTKESTGHQSKKTELNCTKSIEFTRFDGCGNWTQGVLRIKNTTTSEISEHKVIRKIKYY